MLKAHKNGKMKFGIAETVMGHISGRVGEDGQRSYFPLCNV
jgi:hypothetical protein